MFPSNPLLPMEQPWNTERFSTDGTRGRGLVSFRVKMVMSSYLGTNG